jgi:hypothetical protein
MSLRDVLKKRAEEAGNPNANVQVQNVAATEASKDAQPNVGDTIQTGLLSGSEIGQDAGPQEVVMLVPDEEKLAKAETCYEAVRALPFIAMPDGSKLHPDNGYYYLSKEVAEEADFETYVKRGNAIQIK